MPYKLETHLHTKGNSNCAKVAPPEIAAEYASKGYDAIICTNHFNNVSWLASQKGIFKKAKNASFLRRYYELIGECAKYNIRVYFGMELAIWGEDYTAYRRGGADILIFGITPEEFLDISCKLIYRSTHASVHALAREKGWVLVQAHPFRDGPKRTKQWESCNLDGAEVFNSHTGHSNDNAAALAFARDNGLFGTAGSDYHEPGMARCGILMDELPSDEKELARKLAAGDFCIFEDYEKIE